MNVTIKLPDDLIQQAEEHAEARGESLDALMQEALQTLLDEREDDLDAEAIREAKAQVASGEDEFLDWETVKASLGL